MSKSIILYHLGFLCFLFDLLVGARVSCAAQRHKNDTGLRHTVNLSTKCDLKPTYLSYNELWPLPDAVSPLKSQV